MHIGSRLFGSNISGLEIVCSSRTPFFFSSVLKRPFKTPLSIRLFTLFAFFSNHLRALDQTTRKQIGSHHGSEMQHYSPAVSFSCLLRYFKRVRRFMATRTLSRFSLKAWKIRKTTAKTNESMRNKNKPSARNAH